MTDLVDDWTDVRGEPVANPKPEVRCSVCEMSERDYQRCRLKDRPENFYKRAIHPTTSTGEAVGHLTLCPWCASFVYNSYKAELDNGLYKKLWAELGVLRQVVAGFRERTSPENLKGLIDEANMESETEKPVEIPKYDNLWAELSKI